MKPEPVALVRVWTDMRLAIQKARIDKKMSQAELAKQINERPQVVQANDESPSSNPGVLKQDWEPVVLQNRWPKGADQKDPNVANQALGSGTQVETVKKSDGGLNKKTAVTAVNPRKLNEAVKPVALVRVSTDVRLAIQKARIDKKMSQAELAKQINERPQVVQRMMKARAALQAFLNRIGNRCCCEIGGQRGRIKKIRMSPIKLADQAHKSKRLRNQTAV